MSRFVTDLSVAIKMTLEETAVLYDEWIIFLHVRHAGHQPGN